MRLFERGEASFIFLWVLNPIVILFYQNCSPARLDEAERIESRRPASAITQEEARAWHHEEARVAKRSNFPRP